MYRKSVKMGDQVNSENSEQFLSRVGNLPIVASTIGTVTDLYEKTKGSNNLVKYTLETAENGVSVVASTAKPVIEKFEKPIASLNTVACGQLDKLEKSYPLITKPTDEVMSQSKEYYDSNLKPTVDAVTSKVTGVKDYTAEKIGSVKQYSLDTVESTKKFTTDKVNFALKVARVDGLIDTLDPYVEQYLPVENKESDEKLEVDEVTTDTPLEKVAAVSDKVRRRMYAKAMRDLQNVQLRTKETLEGLNFTVNLIDYAKSNIDGVKEKVSASKEKLSTYWTEINKDEETASNEKVEGEESGEVSEETMERKVLATARHLTQRLKKGFSAASETVNTYMPTTVQTKFTEGKKFTEDLYTNFMQAESYSDISQKVIDQSKEKLTYLTETMAFLTEYISKSQMMSWMVSKGSSSPKEIEMDTIPPSQKDQESKKEDLEGDKKSDENGASPNEENNTETNHDNLE